MADYSELKRLADAQTEKVWIVEPGSESMMRGEGRMYTVDGPECVSDYEHWGFTERSASFIAAANPATVLALIAEVDQHQSLYDHMKLMREAYGYASWTEVLTVAEKLKAEVEALRKAAEKVIEMNRQHAEDQYGDPDKAESWSCVTVLRAAMSKECAQ